MDIAKAKKLIQSVADGVDPFTGELLPEDSVCNRADMVRAFHCVLAEIDKNSAKRGKTTTPENAGKPWNEKDERILGSMFDRGCSVKEMQTYFKRTKGAIIARLVQMGKMVSSHQAK